MISLHFQLSRARNTLFWYWILFYRGWLPCAMETRVLFPSDMWLASANDLCCYIEEVSLMIIFSLALVWYSNKQMSLFIFRNLIVDGRPPIRQTIKRWRRQKATGRQVLCARTNYLISRNLQCHVIVIQMLNRFRPVKNWQTVPVIVHVAWCLVLRTDTGPNVGVCLWVCVPVTTKWLQSLMRLD